MSIDPNHPAVLSGLIKLHAEPIPLARPFRWAMGPHGWSGGSYGPLTRAAGVDVKNPGGAVTAASGAAMAPAGLILAAGDDRLRRRRPV